MNWLWVAYPIAFFYVIWFGRLLYKKDYTKPLLFFALAHFPYLLINLVAPIRGVLDPNYAGFSFGWIVLSPGILVTIIVGSIVIGCFIIATKALQNNMKGFWVFALIFDSILTIMIALPVLINVLTDLQGNRIELGEYLQLSGLIVAAILFVLFSGPTFYANYLAAKEFRSEMIS